MNLGGSGRLNHQVNIAKNSSNKEHYVTQYVGLMMITLMMIASVERDERQAVLLGSNAHNITTPRQDRKYHISRKTISSFHTLLQHIVPAGASNLCAVAIIMLQLPSS